MASGALTGAVTLIQRFGSALNLNVQLHMLFLDGTNTCATNRPTFNRARRPVDEELNHLLETLSRRIVRARPSRSRDGLPAGFPRPWSRVRTHGVCGTEKY